MDDPHVGALPSSVPIDCHRSAIIARQSNTSDAYVTVQRTRSADG